MKGFFAAHQTPVRSLKVVLAGGSIALAVAAGVSAFQHWHAAGNAAETQATFGWIRRTSANEEKTLRTAYATQNTPASRTRFFDSAQEETTLLATLSGSVGVSDLQLVRGLERLHGAAVADAARALRGDVQRGAALNRALRDLDEVQLRSATAQIDDGIGTAKPWPATPLQMVELGDLVLVLCVGFLTLLGAVSRAAGLRRTLPDQQYREIERLTYAARSDSLTGLANHRAFQDDLSRAFARRNATGTPFALLAFDLDGLKQTNDLHGHHAGDVYIKAVASCLATEVGERGTVYRTGGDEFMAILTNARGWHALTIAHNIQREARKATGKRALSIGITESTVTESRKALLHQADLALYEAKRTQLLVVSYHTGLEPRDSEDGASGPSQYQKSLAAALARAVDAKDAETRNHSETVAELCAALGARLGIEGEQLERLRIAGLVHDVGKIGVSDAVLNKRGKLGPIERSEVELHTSVGHSILTSAELHEEAIWVLHHHERVDGGGYPSGLVGEAIPLESRIIAVADAFEAMTGSRPYRTARTPAQALVELTEHGGSQFDLGCVAALNDLFGFRPGESDVETSTLPVSLSA